jgi:two-component system NarL family sensor kinase
MKYTFWTLLLALPTTLAAQPANSRLDSLQAVLRAHPQADTSRVKTLNELVWEQRASNPTQALALTKESLRLARQLRFSAGIAKAYNLQGILYSMSGDFDRATAAYHQAQPLYEALHDYVHAGNVLNNLANVLVFQGHYQQAAESYIRDLRIEEKYGTPEGVAITLGNLGNVHTSMGQHRQALAYYQQWLRSAQAHHDAYNQGSALLNVGLAYRMLKQPEQARAYLRQALAQARKTGIKKNEAAALYNMGAMLTESRQLAEADRVHRQALAIERQIDDQGAIAKSLLALGEVAELQNQFPQARTYYQQSLALAESIGTTADLLETHRGLANAYGGLGDYRNAYDHQLLATLYKDTLLSETTTRQVTEMQTKYETEKKEARNRLQAAQLKGQRAVIGRRNLQLLAGAVVALLLLGLAYLLYNRRRLQQKVELEQERQRLEHLRAAAVLEAEEAERRRIGADLHDGVGQLLTAAKLNLHALGEELSIRTEGQQAMLQNALDIVDESFREVRSISHNLMPNALIKRGLALAVRDFLSKISPDGRLKVQLEVVGLDQGGRLDPTVENVLFRVIQELVQNIVKHAQASQITLQILRSEEDLTVMVEDNGVGFDPAALGPDAGIGLKNIETPHGLSGWPGRFRRRPRPRHYRHPRSSAGNRRGLSGSLK